MNDAILI